MKLSLSTYAYALQNDKGRIGLFLGGQRPPKPSPQGGGWGNPVSPCPNLGAAGAPQAGVRFDKLTAGGETRFPRIFTSGIHAAAPHKARMKILLFLGGLRPPKPSPLAGCFLGGLRPPKPSRWGGLVAPTGRGMGKPGFPVFSPQITHDGQYSGPWRSEQGPGDRRA